MITQTVTQIWEVDESGTRTSLVSETEGAISSEAAGITINDSERIAELIGQEEVAQARIARADAGSDTVLSEAPADTPADPPTQEIVL